MSDDFAKRIMAVDFDVDYTAAEISSAEGGRAHFSRYLESILSLLRVELNADRGVIALTGFEIGVFTPMAQFGYHRDHLLSLSTSDIKRPENQMLRSGRPFILRSGGTSLAKDGSGGSAQQIHISLLGHGEIIGFISLERLHGLEFDPTAVEVVRDAIPLLTTLIAEQNFSIRVHRLAQAFNVHGMAGDEELKNLFHAITDLTALAFAADAVVLRAFDAKDRKLVAVASRGEIDADLLAPRGPGEHIAGRLLESEEHDWAAIDGAKHGVPSGMPIEESDRQELHSAGVDACLIVRLTSEVSEAPEERHIGTLAYHMRRPHRFSWRDLVLFRSFCQRVADAIALERQTQRLRQSKEDLEHKELLLLSAYSQATNTDLIVILAHDLFHSSFHACTTLEEFIKRAEKHIKKFGVDDAQMKEDGDQATQAARRIYLTLSNLRSLHKSIRNDEAEKPTDIKLKAVVDEIETVLNGPLKRLKIAIKRNFGNELSFWGPKSIFGYVIFNLIINSIDAAKTRSTGRPMSIHIHARKESAGKGERLVIKFWDEGPGINRQVFRNPNDVFLIGKSTKPNGTGIGLPVTRQILHNHFDGSIVLEDPATALFTIQIPLQ